MDLKNQITELAARAKKASLTMAKAEATAKTNALNFLSEMLKEGEQSIIEANSRDIEKAEKDGLDAARIDRLRLTPEIIDEMAAACSQVADMSDPIGEIESLVKRPNGMLVGKMRIPLGVVAMIYESRPNATIEASILCLKAGNGVILRGGSEAFHSNQALSAIISKALVKAGLPEEAVQVMPTTDREAVKIMLKQEAYIDVVIPRGGEGLIKAVVAEATMPVLKHYKGVCHIYVDKSADLNNAVDIIHNAKVQRPGVCNALEGLLVHKDIAGEILPRIAKRLGAEGVTFHACPESLPLLGDTAMAATDEDWGKEYLSLDLAVRIVKSQDAAHQHITEYASNHTESILTRDYERALRFIREVDASAVMINSSTRFNDGGQFGLGAEIGISTSKLHAYGPMGVNDLTSTKFVVFGQGQIRT